MVDDNLLMSQNIGIKWMKKPNNIKIETMAALRGEDDQILHLSLISAPVNDDIQRDFTSLLLLEQ